MHSLIDAAAAPGFDDPLEMLLACHGRIEAQCDTLHRLVAHLTSHGKDAQAHQAARAILRYFDTAGRHHHEDEERDLFPQLLATRNQTACTLVARLLEEHQTIEAKWQKFRPHVSSIADNRSDRLDAQIAKRFISLYTQHIALENAELLPLACSLLNAKQLRLLGHSMAARRGVSI
jgi:hemerythrin-like domain-containing protein